ncbi:MAG: hypothetical protein WBI69_06220 [Limnochordia bacterium]
MRKIGWSRLAGHWFMRLRAWFKDENLYFRFFALFLAVILWFFAGGHSRLIPAEPAAAKRQLAVVARFAGELSPGLGLRSFAVEPETLDASIPPELAGTVEALVTEPIWLTGLAAGEYDLMIGVVKPPKVELAVPAVVRVKLVIAWIGAPFVQEQMPSPVPPAPFPEPEPEPEPAPEPQQPEEPAPGEPILPVEPEPEPRQPEEPVPDEPILPVEPEPNHSNRWIPPPKIPDSQ